MLPKTIQWSRSSRTPARPTPSISRPAASRPECASSRPAIPSRPASRFASTPLEARLAPLCQRCRALAKIFGTDQRALRQHLEFLKRHLVQAVAFVDDPLRQTDRDWRVARHLARKLFGRSEEHTSELQ